MTITYPSRDFDDAVAAVCHGVASDEQVAALNALLRTDDAAVDEYILRIELHSRLASEEDLFILPEVDAAEAEGGPSATLDKAPESAPVRRRPRARKQWWAIGMAACFALLAIAGWWRRPVSPEPSGRAATSKAVAMLHQTVDARWSAAAARPQLGAPLDPGWLRLEDGLAQIVFYRGARVVIEGPADFRLITADHAEFRHGKLTAEVPTEAQGFRIETPQGIASGHGVSFGLEVSDQETEAHAFEGNLSWLAAVQRELQSGEGVRVSGSQTLRVIAAERDTFASLLNLRERLLTAETLRLNRWRSTSDQLNADPSLRVRFEFDEVAAAPWQLRNASEAATARSDATVIGCQFAQGRWPGKRAIEFQGVSDRVRLNVRGEFEAVTLAAWVRVQGLDRRLNSLFMSDGFEPGTLHWLIRNDGVVGLTVVGETAGNYQVVTSPPELALDRFGMWVHLAVVVDGRAGRAAHYFNGRLVRESDLRISPPFRIGAAELGNWNGRGFPKDDPFMIRNFSGAMDEFCLFSRALGASEIGALYAQGRPEMDAVALRE